MEQHLQRGGHAGDGVIAELLAALDEEPGAPTQDRPGNGVRGVGDEVLCGASHPLERLQQGIVGRRNGELHLLRAFALGRSGGFLLRRRVLRSRGLRTAQLAAHRDPLHLEHLRRLPRCVALADGDFELLSQVLQLKFETDGPVSEIVALRGDRTQHLARGAEGGGIVLAGDESRAAQDVDAPFELVDFAQQLGVLRPHIRHILLHLRRRELRLRWFRWRSRVEVALHCPK